jgi:hypothetical protein
MMAARTAPPTATPMISGIRLVVFDDFCVTSISVLEEEEEKALINNVNRWRRTCRASAHDRNGGVTIGEVVVLPNEVVRTKSSWWLVRLVAQYEPDIRDVLFAKVGLAIREHLQGHLQVVVHVDEWVVDGDRVHREAVTHEFGSYPVLENAVVRAVGQVGKRRRSEEQGASVWHRADAAGAQELFRGARGWQPHTLLGSTVRRWRSLVGLPGGCAVFLVAPGSADGVSGKPATR